MITGTTLLEHGWAEGPALGAALDAARAMADGGLDDGAILDALATVKAAPQAVEATSVLAPLAKALMLDAAKQAEADAPRPTEVRQTPLDAPVWGRELIDAEAIHQLENAMRLPVAVAGALMPDAHVGYGIPIGGVVALDGAVAPYMVGVDIACRMMMSIYPGHATQYLANANRKETLTKVLREETRFGIGASFHRHQRRDHAVLDDPDWEATGLLRGLKDKAAAQLGTSGSGNHFVDVGLLDVDARGAEALGIEAGTHLAIMSHSGSRGVGAQIANHYSKLAQRTTVLPDKLRHLAWLDLDSEAGEAYWLSMNLAGRFASACHHTIHEALAKRLKLKPAATVENHHNFCIAGGSYVPTPSGPRCIETLEPGDTVYSHDPDEGLVTSTVTNRVRTGTRAVVEVQTDSRALRCTPDHRLQVVEDGALTWKEAGALAVGDIVACAAGYYAGTDARPESCGPARLVGAFLGDGWVRHARPEVSGYTVGLAIGDEAEPHTHEYLQLVRDLLPAAGWRVCAPGAFGLTCSSKAVHDRVRELGLGVRSLDKRLPRRAFTYSVRQKRALLAGYFDADGSVSTNEKNRGRGTVASTNASLVRDLREIAIGAGLRASKVSSRQTTTNYGRCIVHRFAVAASSMAELPLWHRQKRRGLNAEARGSLGLTRQYLGGAVLRTTRDGCVFGQRVRRVEPCGVEVPTYDITVDHSSHSFVCEGVIVHNCWREEIVLPDGSAREAYVHRKGATPAHAGALGIIPGSQGHNSYLVRGLGAEAALNSASHGAGRAMSRTQAKRAIPKRDRDAWLAERGVELLDGGMDEAPQAYKDIGEVLALQADLVEPLATFKPRLVLMARGGRAED